MDNFYNYPLLIKQLLISPLLSNPNQKIINEKNISYDYKTFNNRVSILSNSLTHIGVEKGDTIGVMDWDTTRYLECFFAIPMMGAILHTINIRLSEQQILYTINHADDDFLLINEDFLPTLNKIKDGFERDIKIIIMEGIKTETKKQKSKSNYLYYEKFFEINEPNFVFEDFDENTVATKFYTTGTTGNPKGVSYSHRQLVIHTLGFIVGSSTSNYSHRFHNEDVYMPLTPMFHVHGWGFPYMATLLGVKQVYPSKYEPKKLLDLIEKKLI